MPTITIFKQDLEGLLAGPGEARQLLTIEQLEESLMLVKGELKGQNLDTGELRIGARVLHADRHAHDRGVAQHDVRWQPTVLANPRVEYRDDRTAAGERRVGFAVRRMCDQLDRLATAPTRQSMARCS